MSNDGQYHVVMTIIYVGYHQRGERCSPTSLPRPSTSSAYCFNCAVNAVPRQQRSSSDKPDLPTTNVSYNFVNDLQLAKTYKQPG